MAMLPKHFTPPHEIVGLPKDTPMLVAFSGGADSSVLLHLLTRLRKETNAPLYAAHVNHGIRGKEADRDEEFCRRTAEALGVPIFVLRADLPSEAKKTGESIETAARRVRYDYFDALMAENHISLLVTAHNANDNLETILFHLSRGSGLSGLCGIPLWRNTKYGRVVRPMLGMTKEEILAYCQEHRIEFVNDSTNVDTDYTRNRIRSEVVPALRAIHPAAVENAARLAEHLSADAEYLDKAAANFLTEAREENAIPCEKITGSPSPIAHRALRMLYRELSGKPALETTHLTAICRLAERAVPHSSTSLPLGFEARVENGRLTLQKAKSDALCEPYEIALSVPKTRISQTKCEIVIEPSQSVKNIYKTSIQFALNSATIKGTPTVRNRREGDRILMAGHHKSLKKLFCEKKVPPKLRATLPIFCDEDGILAVPTVGVRDGALPMDEEHAITVTVDFFE